MTTILITGGTGLLGVTWAMQAQRHSKVIVGLHRRKVTVPGATGLALDLGDPASIASALRSDAVDLVVHSAALTSVEACENDPAAARALNVDAAANVAKACAEVGAGLIHISTDHLFDGERDLYDEDDPPQPKNVYGLTKARGEEAVLKAHPAALVARTNFYGWGPPYRASFSDWILTQLERRQSPALFTDVRYTPILASQLVAACTELHQRGARGIFNVTSDEALSKYDFGVMLAERFGYSGDVIRSDLFTTRHNMVSRPRNMALSNRKARDILGRSLGDAGQHIALLQQEASADWVQRLRSLANR